MANASETPVRQVVVVGGSPVGLSTAIALAHEGTTVTVLERTPHGGYEGGGGLGVDVDLLARVTGLAGVRVRPPSFHPIHCVRRCSRAVYYPTDRPVPGRSFLVTPTGSSRCRDCQAAPATLPRSRSRGPVAAQVCSGRARETFRSAPRHP